MKLVEPVQMNIYQSNTYREDPSCLHFDDEPRVQKRQKSYISKIKKLFLITFSSIFSNQFLLLTKSSNLRNEGSHMNFPFQNKILGNYSFSFFLPGKLYDYFGGLLIVWTFWNSATSTTEAKFNQPKSEYYSNFLKTPICKEICLGMSKKYTWITVTFKSKFISISISVILAMKTIASLEYILLLNPNYWEKVVSFKKNSTDILLQSNKVRQFFVTSRDVRSGSDSHSEYM